LPAIPRILHQIWLGPNSVPTHLLEYQQTWKKHHPCWRFILWTEENLPAGLRRPEVYEKLRVPAERADILRLELLWVYGGVYVDADFECLRSIETLLEDYDFFATYFKPGRVANALIGAAPEHAIIDHALTAIQPREYFGLDKAGFGTSFTKVLSQHPGAKIFDPPLFYPATPAEREHAFTVHHSERSWRPEEGWKAVAIRAEARRDIATRRLEAIERKRAGWREKCEEARRELERRSLKGRLRTIRSLFGRRTRS
jgi:hypothetical protein